MTIVVTPSAGTPLADITRDVMMFLPSIPIFEVEHLLKQTLRDFCRRSLVWRQPDTRLLTTVAGQKLYPSSLPLGTELAAVLSAWDGETELTVIDADDEGSPGDTCQWPDVALFGDDAIRLSPAPSIGGRIYTGSIALSPNEASTEIPAFIYRRWREAIKHGCTSRAMMEVGKPWSNPNQAMYHEREYDAMATEASNSAGPVRRQGLRVKSW